MTNHIVPHYSLGTVPCHEERLETLRFDRGRWRFSPAERGWSEPQWERPL